MDQGPTSLTLLARVRSNDPDGWSRLLALYAPLVRHWVLRGHARGADVEDLVQEVFSAVADSLDLFRRDRPGDTFRGWLHGITRNKLLLHYRRLGRQPVATGGTDAHRKMQQVAEAGIDEFSMDDTAESELVKRALDLVRDGFESRTWQAFWRCAVDGLSAADVANELGISTVAVRKAKSRVLLRLRQELGDL